MFSLLTPEVSNCALEKQVDVSFILLYIPSLKNDNFMHKWVNKRDFLKANIYV